jgi:hypothetical protein
MIVLYFYFNVVINCGEMIFYTRIRPPEYVTVTGFKYHVESCNMKIPSVLEMALPLQCIVLPL